MQGQHEALRKEYMTHWNSSPHPISDIRDWSSARRLELRPDFQRREVWSMPAKVMLMDTIFRDIPMPKVFLANSIKNENTYRVVIDGQQRLSAILDFLRDEYSLEKPYAGEHKGKKFSELDQKTKNRFLSYVIDFNEAVNPSEDEVREVYARVNKYTVPLTKQELRRADFPGDFLEMSEKFAQNSYFDRFKIFTPSNLRRYADVEYVSELLAAMIDGIQDKKVTLDNFYMEYASWSKRHKHDIEARFDRVLQHINFIFSGNLHISESRFSQKADFYTLFHLVDEFVRQGLTLEDKYIEPLQDDMETLDFHIRPESDIRICSEYAIKCVSQANSASSRRWRYNFLKPILAGTYIGGKPDEAGAKIYYKLMEGVLAPDAYGLCPSPEFDCPVCESEANSINFDNCDNCVLAWLKSDTANQLNNAHWLHSSCAYEQSDWLVLERPREDHDQATIF